MNEDKYDKEIMNIITEQRKTFECGDESFYIYPMTLGKALLIGSEMEKLGIAGQKDQEELVRAVYKAHKENKTGLCKIIAYHTMDKREELLDVRLVRERAIFLAAHISDTTLASTLFGILNEIPLEQLKKHVGITDDQKQMAKINRVKEKSDKNSFSFGGHTLMGALIVPACEKLHMNPRQIVWEISYRFLQMLMADAVTSVYLTDDERKKAHVVRDRRRVEMDKNTTEEVIKTFDWS